MPQKKLPGVKKFAVRKVGSRGDLFALVWLAWCHAMRQPNRRTNKLLHALHSRNGKSDDAVALRKSGLTAYTTVGMELLCSLHRWEAIDPKRIGQDDGTIFSPEWLSLGIRMSPILQWFEYKSRVAPELGGLQAPEKLLMPRATCAA